MKKNDAFCKLKLLAENQVNEYMKVLLSQLRDSLNNKLQFKDGRLAKFFGNSFSLARCNELVELLNELERNYPSEIGVPVITQNVEESAKVSGFSPMSIINELEKVSGISLNKRGIKKQDKNKSLFVAKIVKPRNSLSKKQSMFSKANDTIKPKRDIKGKFVKE